MIASSAVLWGGPSVLDGRPVVAIATGLNGRSGNAKTGPMAQTWILRADIAPFAAVASGDDAAVCGMCPHRPALGATGDDACYVRTVQAPGSIWRAYRAGRYPQRTPSDVSAECLARGLPIRIGSYGDPAAVPANVWSELLSVQSSHTGYTHQWKWASALRPILMASVDSESEANEARAAGWRYFRTRAQSDPIGPGEVTCPASKEAGHRTTCANCKLCAGATITAKSVVIVLH